VGGPSASGTSLGSRALAAVGVSPVFQLSVGSPPLATDAAGEAAGSSARRGGSIVLEGSDDVDYTRLRASTPFRAFAVATAELQRVDLLPLNHDERLAFFANVYNTLVLHAHAVYGPPTSLLRRWVFFRTLSYRVGGTDWTLDDIEHGVLRANARPPFLKFVQQLRVGDPRTAYVLGRRDGRIHFVISAGTVSDPPVRILEGEDVEEVLDEATTDFLDVAVSVDTEARVVRVPRIFWWYAGDFPRGTAPLLRWIARYVRDELRVALLALVDGAPPASPALAKGAPGATGGGAGAGVDGLLRRTGSVSAASGGGESPSVTPMAAAVSPGVGGYGDVPSVTITYENFDWTADARFSAAVVRRKRRRLARAAAAAAAAAAGTAPTGHLPPAGGGVAAAGGSLPPGATLPDGTVVGAPAETLATGVYSSTAAITAGMGGSPLLAAADGGAGGGPGRRGGGGLALPASVAVPDVAAMAVPDVGAPSPSGAAGRRGDQRGGPPRPEVR